MNNKKIENIFDWYMRSIIVVVLIFLVYSKVPSYLLIFSTMGFIWTLIPAFKLFGVIKETEVKENGKGEKKTNSME